ncbi:MAG: hypothetical protein NBV61_08925 [Algoriphagus sp.]|jgi:hypothetical protein|nr:hypothetical protein [Algoriphagus sp.]
MERNAGQIAIAYLKHWLVKEDRYSQQSPFIFSVYQGALDLLKKEKPSSKAEKIALLAAYFCQITPANQVLELGIGNETITKSLNQVAQGKLFKIPALESLAQETEADSQQIQDQQSFDFVLIHPQSSENYLQEVLNLIVPRMHTQGILLLAGIHQSQGMNASWKKVQAGTRIHLTLDFFDFGVAFVSYSGPKTNLSLSY